jgi:hypothetical protein
VPSFEDAGDDAVEEIVPRASGFAYSRFKSYLFENANASKSNTADFYKGALLLIGICIK